MQFLKTLFWVILAVVLVLFASANWQAVTVNLWGNLQADVKLPLLVVGAFLLGFLPTLIVYRTRLWSLQRRLETQAQAHVVSRPAPPARPVPAANAPDRQATDAKAWPAE
jgi:lipopolysaccharide assembly protein A